MRASMSPSRGSGRKRGLRFGSENADRGVMDSGRSTARARRAAGGDSRERGQALVEFALIAPLFLVIVVGIIQFGIGLNYWLDLNRLANQGARFAVVDHGWDGCPFGASAATCLQPDNTLQNYLKEGRTSGGNDLKAKVVMPTGTTPHVGKSVTVQVASCFTFLPILDLGTIVLKGNATMRVEQEPTRYSDVANDYNAVDPDEDDICPDP
jgi:TadE-like protein